MRTSALEKKATSKSYKLYVALVVTFNILPHSLDLPSWIMTIAAIFIIWSILNIYRNFKLPSLFFRNLLVVISSALIYMNYKTFFGPDAAAALFVVVAAVKLVDFTKYRDGMIEILLCYFLLLTHLLHSQTLASTLFFTIDVFVITTLMHQLHKNDRRHSIRTFLPSIKMLFLAMPIWIFLFLVFPRFSASLMHTKPSQAASGFSSQLTPGSVGQLIHSDDTAFRVKFDHRVRNDDMYFRGAVLSESDGLIWKKSRIDDKLAAAGSDPASRTETKRSNGPTSVLNISQEYVIEPNFQHTLFALDFPVVVSAPENNSALRKTGDVFELKDSLQTRSLYKVESAGTNDEKLSAEDREIYLQVPPLSKKVILLAGMLANDAPTSRDKISKILRYFVAQKFAYSLEPGQMLVDGLSTFLFERKLGFCEHYAASLSTLARLMGVPSRVVLGFQGGKFNEMTGYYVVKSSDAHAWSEYWSDEEQKWKRIDPTSVVAPIRVSFGAEAYKQGLNEQSMLEARDSVTSQISSSIFFAVDAVTTKWNNFLLSYDFAYQNKLLENFGFSKSNRITLFVLLCAGLAALTAALKIYFATQKTKTDPVLSLYHQFCRKLDSAGIMRSVHEGPEDFKLRAIAKLPERASAIRDIMDSFIQIRYSGVRDASSVKSLRQSVRKFSL